MGTLVIAMVFLAMGIVLLAAAPALGRPAPVLRPGVSRSSVRRGGVEGQSGTVTRVRYDDGIRGYAELVESSPYPCRVDARL